MQESEYCELWWSESHRPRLTFFSPVGGETVSIELDAARGDDDEWDAMRKALTELELSGWQLVSTPQHSGGLFFRRHLN